MKQILQNIRSGKLNVSEVADSGLGMSGVLIAAQASVISAGTERMITEFADNSLKTQIEYIWKSVLNMLITKEIK